MYMLIFLILTFAVLTAVAAPLALPSSALQDWFRPHNSTGSVWNGGDGGTTLRLPDGRTLWLFGDSWLGIGLSASPTEPPQFLWATDSNGTPVSFFSPSSSSPEDFWWVVEGIAYGSATQYGLVLLTDCIKITNSSEPMGFSVIGTSVIHVPYAGGDPRTSWKTHSVCDSAVANSQLTWSTALKADRKNSSGEPADGLTSSVVLFGSYKLSNGGFGGVVASRYSSDCNTETAQFWTTSGVWGPSQYS